MEKLAVMEDFFGRVKKAKERILLLDYDGTLAPFNLERDKALPYPEAKSILQDLIREKTSRVLVISGRAINDLIPLLGLSEIPEIWGSHGWERRLANGEQVLFPMPAAQRAALTQAEAAADALHPGSHFERKPASAALHWRGLDPETKKQWHEKIEGAWSEFTQSAGLELKEFDGGLELRVPGRDKGVAVSTVLSEAAPHAAVAYLGDDLTDEDAFRALGDRGLSVLVRKEPRSTLATLRLEPPEELIVFLQRWRESCR